MRVRTRGRSVLNKGKKYWLSREQVGACKGEACEIDLEVEGTAICGPHEFTRPDEAESGLGGGEEVTQTICHCLGVFVRLMRRVDVDGNATAGSADGTGSELEAVGKAGRGTAVRGAGAVFARLVSRYLSLMTIGGEGRRATVLCVCGI
ncbi:hypothetical protein HAX54_017440 [Datura stramonium]|uniref:Uncharacterized protein n=1 Tax=Datura stramonium TaxID=4076 RepID=A0ABS8UNN0_DATST|nr:hypothetical protein [Datura stramonium]